MWWFILGFVLGLFAGLALGWAVFDPDEPGDYW